jgi:NADPH:quinone reductase
MLSKAVLAQAGVCTRIGTLSRMKALVLPQFSGPQALEMRDVPEPRQAAGEVIVKTEAGGLNFADVLTAAGGYPGLPKPPLVAGREFAGVEQASGDRVMGYTQWGAFAEQISIPRHLLWPVPARWSSVQAAAFPVNFFTAYFAYWKAGLAEPSPSSPPRVLIHAVAGGVGTAAVEIGKVLGVETYGTSSSDQKLAHVKELGLNHGINYKRTDYEEAIREMTNGEGVDAVFEMLGGEHTTKSVRCLRDFGRVITYGAATGKPSQVDPRILYAKGTSVHGLWLTQLSKNRDLMANAWKRLSAWADEGKLHPVIGHTFPLDRAQEAYQLLIEGKNYGKVVLTIP